MEGLQVFPDHYDTYMFTLFVITMAVTLLLVACATLFLILNVNDSLMDHFTLLLRDLFTSLLAACVKDSSTSRHRELIAVLLVSNTLGKRHI